MTQTDIVFADAHTLEVLRRLTGAILRCNELHCQGHGLEPCTDAEYDAALQAAEDELRRHGELDYREL